MGFVSTFIIGGLQKDVTVEEIYNTLELAKFPNQGVMNLSLVVDKHGRSKGFALLEISRSCTNRLLQYDECIMNGQSITITRKDNDYHGYRILRNRKWLKNYKDKGMAKTAPVKPQGKAYRYKTKNSVFQNSDIDPLYDMFADLTHKKFASELDTVLAQSYKLGINTIVIPSQCNKQRQAALAMVSTYASAVKIYLSTGIAPRHANEYDENIHSEIEKDCLLAEYRCIGPIGLDFRLEKVPREQQIHAFEQQIKLACVKRKPLYLVEHEAHQEFVDILTKYDKQLPKCAIVNFAGTLEELKKYVSMGFYIVIYGSITRGISLLTTVMAEALLANIIPRKQILLSSNAPRQPHYSILCSPSHLTCISDLSIMKLPEDRPRSVPPCIFATLELTAKHMGCKKMEEINELGKEIVNNSRYFLGLTVETSKDKKKSKLVWITEQLKVFVKAALIFLLCLLPLVIFLEYILGILEIQSKYFKYFYRQTVVFIAAAVAKSVCEGRKSSPKTSTKC